MFRRIKFYCKTDCFGEERRSFSHNGGRYTAFLRFTTPYGGKNAPQKRLYGTPSTARTAGSCGRSAAFTTALLSPASFSTDPKLPVRGKNHRGITLRVSLGKRVSSRKWPFAEMAFIGLYTAFHSFWRVRSLPRPIKSHTGTNKGQRHPYTPLPFCSFCLQPSNWGMIFLCIDLPGIGAPPRMRPAYSRRLCLPSVRANSVSFAPPQAAELTHFIALPLPSEIASLGFAGGPKQMGIALRQRYSISHSSQRFWPELSDQTHFSFRAFSLFMRIIF